MVILAFEVFVFFFNDTATTEIYTLSLHDALPIYGLEDLGFVPRSEGGAFIAERNTAPGVPGTARRAGRPGIPLNTNGGSLSYMHSGMYGMYALQESMRRMRGTAPPRSPMPRSRCATASAACSPPPARSFSRTRDLSRSDQKAKLVTILGGNPIVGDQYP